MLRTENLLKTCILVSLSVLLVACTPAPAEPTSTPLPPTATAVPSPTATATAELEPPALPFDLSNVGVLTPTIPISEQTLFGYTYQKPNGNRLVPGLGRMTSAIPVDIPIPGKPAWLVGVPVDGGGTIWVAVLEDGLVQAFLILAGQVSPLRIQPERLPAGMPPMLVMHRGAPYLLTASAGDASPLTHPVVIGDDPANFAYLALNGDLVINQRGEITRLEVDGLPDARILQDPRGRLLLVSGPTDRYRHGVLGDQLEGSSLTLVGTDPLEILRVIPAGAQVIEGMAPIWSDLNDDGDWEIVVTLADEAEGARIVIFNEEGERIAEGPATGRGYTWLHQLVAAPFEGGPNLVIAANLTPHINGITEFLRWDPEFGLYATTSVDGFSTHRLGSRNLDMVLAGDLDGDGVVELLVPADSGDRLTALRAQSGFATIAWTVDLGAELTTNIAAVVLPGGLVAVGVGLADGSLRLWLP